MDSVASNFTDKKLIIETKYLELKNKHNLQLFPDDVN